jgi:hypothetical protein
MPLAAYRHEVAAFARKAREPFAGMHKRFYMEWEQDMFEEFWREYELLLVKHGSQ